MALAEAACGWHSTIVTMMAPCARTRYPSLSESASAPVMRSRRPSRGLDEAGLRASPLLLKSQGGGADGYGDRMAESACDTVREGCGGVREVCSHSSTPSSAMPHYSLLQCSVCIVAPGLFQTVLKRVVYCIGVGSCLCTCVQPGSQQALYTGTSHRYFAVALDTISAPEHAAIAAPAQLGARLDTVIDSIHRACLVTDEPSNLGHSRYMSTFR
jgi:hypothetical protein